MTTVSTKSKKVPVAYARTESFFKGALRDALQEAILLPRTLVEKQEVRLKPGFETACWSFQPPHRIYVGDKLFDKPNMRPGLTDEQLLRYIRNHYHHEQAHGLFTERDMALIQKALNSIRAPFQAFNLMEDAVIEHRYREVNDYQFRWLEYETLFFSPRPETLLLALIQAEGDREAVENELDKWTPGKAGEPLVTDPEVVAKSLKDTLPRVYQYYERLCKLRSTVAVMPVLNAWLDEFGRPPSPPPGSPGSGMGDMELSITLGLDHEFRQEFEEGSGPLSEESMALGDKGKGKGKAVVDPNYEAESQSGEVLAHAGKSVDMARATALSCKLTPLFKQANRTVSSLVPTKRVSARHMAMGRSPYRKSTVQGKAAKDILIVVDCSGSMGGSHIEEGKVLVSALSLLAQRGFVTGHVALSVVTGGKSFWQTFKFPMAQELIERISAYGSAEGLEYTLKANLAKAKAADYVFVYTDAQICDKPIDKQGLHRQGIDTWGLYAGDGDHILESMLQYFDKAIMRATADELVDAILAQTK
jgi:hypothetical protein